MQDGRSRAGTTCQRVEDSSSGSPAVNGHDASASLFAQIENASEDVLLVGLVAAGLWTTIETYLADITNLGQQLLEERQLRLALVRYLGMQP